MCGVLSNRLDLNGVAARQPIVAEALPLAELPRLAPLLAETTGNVDCELALGRDGDDRIVVTGQIRARLAMTCQRCLEVCEIVVAQAVEMVQARDAQDTAGIEDRYDTVLPAGPVRLADPIEDELLLALPMVAMHESPERCGQLARLISGAKPGDDAGDRQTPFAVLKTLRRDD